MLAISAVLITLLAIYLRRSPEVVQVSEPSITTFEKAWEAIERFFFTISGITYTGRINEGRSSATIVRESYSYTPPPTTRLLQDTIINFQPYDEGNRLLQDTVINFQPYDEGNRRLQSSVPDNEGISSESNEDNDGWRPFGFIDGLAEDKGLVLRAFNPENRIYYINYEDLIKYASEDHSSTSRLLTAQNSQRNLAETTGN